MGKALDSIAVILVIYMVWLTESIIIFIKQPEAGMPRKSIVFKVARMPPWHKSRLRRG